MEDIPIPKILTTANTSKQAAGIIYDEFGTFTIEEETCISALHLSSSFHYP